MRRSVALRTGGVKRRMHGASGLSHLPWEIGIRDVIAVVGGAARFSARRTIEDTENTEREK